MRVDAPSLANLSAASKPSPVFAPVMRTVLPAKEVVGSAGGLRALQRNSPKVLDAGGSVMFGRLKMKQKLGN